MPTARDGSLRHPGAGRWWLALAGALLGCLSHAGAQAATDGLIIGFRNPQAVTAGAVTGPGNSLAQASRVAGVSLTRVRTMGGGAVLARLPSHVSPAEARRIAARLAADPAVAYAEPDRRVHAAFVPNDPLYPHQWSLYEDTAGARLPGAWDLERGSPGITIAVLDTGILSHPDLDGNRVLPGYDFISDPTIANDGNGRDPDPSDPGDWTSSTPSSWHGLMMAGIIMATTDNGTGIAGINHYSRLLPVRVLGVGGGQLSDVLDAMRWAAGLHVTGVPDNPTPARVMNLSFAADGPCGPAEQATVDAVVAAGATVVVAAGNHAAGSSGDVANVTPAGCDNVITVAAVNRSGALAAYSNYGSAVAISAPGGDSATKTDGIESTYNLGKTTPGTSAYGFVDGTSPAAAIVTGVVSLMVSRNPALTPAQVRATLRATARPFPDASCNTSLCGAGLVDARAAVAAADNPLPDPAPASPVSSPSSGGGGGGCTVSKGQHDGSLIVVILFAALGYGWRRRRCDSRLQSRR
ncbi:MAG TPA: S8 family peptidase [Gammaproteobacteria bacterium]|nr:S8 family peptidase [Gammaproteobacteria bacterium]